MDKAKFFHAKLGWILSNAGNADVKWFALSNGYGYRVEHLPSNFATFFPNLVGLQWMGTYLRTIKPSDLSPYPNLVFLGLSMNLIHELDGNLFQNNHKLQFIDLTSNQIQKIGTGLLSGLNSLTGLYLYSNPCTGTAYQLLINPPYNTAADASRDLDSLCGPSTPSEELGTCDPCLANCTARGAALQIRTNTVTESVYAPWYYKMRAFLKAVSLW